MSEREHWSTDAPVSFPQPPPSDSPVLIDFEGFGFSMNGIVHNITEADVEEMTTPYFAPEGFQGDMDPSNVDWGPTPMEDD